MADSRESKSDTPLLACKARLRVVLHCNMDHGVDSFLAMRLLVQSCDVTEKKLLMLAFLLYLAGEGSCDWLDLAGMSWLC